jgi:hypothetical protein
MKTSLRNILLCLCFAAASASAGDYSSTTTTRAAATDTDTVFPFEFDIEYAYIGGGDVERSFRKVRDFDENYGLARFIYRPRTAVGYLRLGAAYERYEFGIPALGLVERTPAGVFVVGHPQLPDTLHSVSAVVGLDTKFSDSLLFRIEAQPGFYGGEDLNSDTFNVPVILGASYIISPDFQLIFGVSVDYERKYPVFPGGGFRWRMGSQWVLNAALPTPRLEFEATKSLTIFAGADLKGSTFRVDKDFGVGRGDNRLNHAILTYSEIRTGGGLEWKINPDVKLSLEGGYLPYRQFDYYRADIRYKYDKGAPYGAVAFRASF